MELVINIVYTICFSIQQIINNNDNTIYNYCIRLFSMTIIDND